MPRETKHVLEVRVKSEAQSPSTALVPITLKEIEQPIKEGGKYMIPKTWVQERQALALMQKTPEKYVMTRPAKGGGSWDYVPGWYVQKVLNFTFGWLWDYEAVQEPTVTEIIQIIEKKIDQIWVTGRLTVKDDAGHSITKTQTGRADIKFRRDIRQPLDIGNDLKAAHTDALKKCASLFGIASDIYGKREAKKEGYNMSDTNVPPGAKPAAATTPAATAPIRECYDCGEIISEAEYTFSKQIYGKAFCRTHQKDAKKS